METKKTPKANLENKKALFTEIGLAISLGIVLVAFEWTSRDVQIVIDALPTKFTVEEDLVPVTTQDEQPKLLPPPPKLADIINITDNDAEIDEDLELINSEIDDNTEISYQNIEVEAEDEEDDDNAIFFTAGLGENNIVVREQILEHFGYMGITLDKEANKIRGEEKIISTPDSKVTVAVIPTNEELAIARETVELLK